MVVNLSVNGDTGAAATTGVGDDTFNGALVGAGAAGTTIQAGDSLNGGTGTDTLQISATGAVGAYTLAGVQLAGIENVSINDFSDAGLLTVDTSLMTGIASVKLGASNGNGDVSFSNMSGIVDASMMNGSGDLAIGYRAATTVGTSDSQNLTISNVSGGTFDASGVETIALTSSLAANTLDAVTGSALKTLTISGDQNTTISTNLANTVTTVNGSTATGKLVLGVAAGGNATITGGTGADTFDMNSGLTKADVIDGGDGADTVKITVGATGASDATGATQAFTDFQITNVETIQATLNDADGTTIDATALPSGLTIVPGTTDTDQTINNIGTQTISIVNNSAGTLEFGDIAINLKDGSSTSDSLTVALTAATKADQTLDLLTIDDEVEALTLSVSGATGTGIEATLSSLVADTAKTVSVNGSGNFVMTLNDSAGTANTTTTVDASAATGTFVYNDGVANAAFTVKGSQGQNTIAMGASLFADDVIVGGASTKDVVSATVGTNHTAVTGKLNLSAIETLALTHTSTQNATVDVSGSTGLSKIQVDGSAADATGTLTLNGLANGSTIALNDANAFDGTIAAVMADATGTADVLNLSLTRDAAGNDDFILTATGVETLNIVAAATADEDTDINVSGLAGTTTINISGGTAAHVLDLTEDTTKLHKGVTTVDASGFAGDLVMDASGTNSVGVAINAGTLSISTTTGDAITGSGSLTSEDTLTGTFAATDADAEFTQLSGIENYVLTVNDAVDITAEANKGLGDGDNVVKTVVIKGGNTLSSWTSTDGAIDGNSAHVLRRV